MPVNIEYLKLSRVDQLYEAKYETYEQLRSAVAAINQSIINEAANVVFDNVYDSYTSAARHSYVSSGINKTESKKRVYGIVVGNSSEQNAGKNIYVDVPLHNLTMVKGDDIFLGEESDLSQYEELIFFPVMNLIQLTPQVGTLCVVEIPENFPNHTITNPEDAVFIDIYSKEIISPVIMERAEPIVIPGSLEEKIRNLEAKAAAAGSGGGGGGSSGGASGFTSGEGITAGSLDLCGSLRIDNSKKSVNPNGSSTMQKTINNSDFIKVVNEIANKYGIPPALILALFYNESATTMSPSICNDLGYCGIFQLGKDGRKQFGISKETFTSMSLVQQAQFFRDKYLPSWFPEWKNASYAKNHPLSIGNFYAAVFLPAGRYFNSEEPLTSKYKNKLTHKWQKTAHYTHNKGLDFDGDGSITIKDLENHLIKVANAICLVGGGDGRGGSGCPDGGEPVVS